jgi:hypothetical protein
MGSAVLANRLLAWHFLVLHFLADHFLARRRHGGEDQFTLTAPQATGLVRLCAARTPVRVRLDSRPVHYRWAVRVRPHAERCHRAIESVLCFLPDSLLDSLLDSFPDAPSGP